MPPKVKPRWDDCGLEAQADLLAFNQIAEHDESTYQQNLAMIKATNSF